MIGKNIYDIRKKKGITLSELADRASISKSYLSNIERNLNQNPSIQVINKIAFVLKVEIKDLLNTGTMEEKQNLLDTEWVDLIHELVDSGVNKDNIHEFKSLLNFIKWKNKNIDENN